MDEHLTTFLELGSLAPVARLAGSGRPAWIWNAAADSILWANAAGAAFFDASSAEDLGQVPGLERSQARPHLARIAAEGPVGKPVLERLRFYKGLRAILLTCQCQRLELPDGSYGALIAAVDGAEAPGDALAAYASLLQGPEHSAFMLDANGTVLAAAGVLGTGLTAGEAAGFEPDTGTLRIAGAFHDALRLPLADGRSLMLVDDQPLELDAPDEVETAAPTVEAAVPEAVELAADEDARSGETAPEEGAEAAAPQSVEEPVSVSDVPATEAAEAPVEDAPASATPARFEPRERSVRFAWKMDVDQRFTFVSPEFTDALGPDAGAITGMTWNEVAERFGLDPRGSIARALLRRDTWSGKTLDWPVDGGRLRVPVDMAALPAFDRRRVFEGYRGFGVVRLGDAEPQAGAPAQAMPLAPEAAESPEPSAVEPAAAEPAVETAPVADLTSEVEAVEALPDVILAPAPELADEAAPDDVEAVAGDEAEEAAPVADEAIEPEPEAASEPEAVSAAEEMAPETDQPEEDEAPEENARPQAAASASAAHSWIEDIKATTAARKADAPRDADLFGDAPKVGITGDQPLKPKEIEKAVRTLAREFDAAVERRAAAREAANAAASAEPRAYRQQVEDTLPEETAAEAAPEEAVPQPEATVQDAAPEALALPDTGFAATEEAADTAEDVTISEAEGDAETASETGAAEVQDEPALEEDADARQDETPALLADEAGDSLAGEAAEAAPAADDFAALEQAMQIATAEPEAQPEPDAEPEGDAAAVAEPQPEPAAPPRPDSRVVPFTGKPTRVVPVDASRLTKPERAAFRKIAEALGARLEGDFGLDDDTEEEIAEAAARLRPVAPPAAPVDPRLLDRLPIGIAIVRDREVLYTNETLLALLGYPNLEALDEAGGFEALFAGPDHLPGDRLEGTLDETMKLRLADGRLKPVFARMHTVPWNGGRGLMVSIIECRQPPAGEASPAPAAAVAAQPSAIPAHVERELARAREQIAEMDTILETATDGVLLLDRFGTILKANGSAEALFGAARVDITGAPLTEFLAPESHRSALDYLDGLSRNGVASVLNDGREVIGRVSSGGLIPLFMTIGRLGQGNDTLKFCAVLRDITQWKAAEEELTKAKRQAETASSQKSDFLAKISHEIRTPLNAIIGFSEVMMEERFGAIGNERYKEYLKDIRTSGSHIMSLINDLLDLSKIEAGKMDLTFAAVSVNEIVRECVALMQPQANRERVIIRASLPGTVPNVVADLRSLRQIVLNLLSNAIKFNRSGGQVIVSSALEPTGEVALRVRDTGTGMNAKDLAAALEPFRQLHTARPGSGTGLGLPLTKALVEANRAAFRIDSVPDQGTLVEIIFPPQRVLAE
ncbi:histidine kinase dimerization/phospho-acceptor domain-containing protein [Pannonibacter phragmitetus]|uniref:histidine kinase dimerization/phospho-acceptor domain-containing protein n=1 Tax=Pannonibacter phragmitetus TaxID=121719 RepID=UPI000F02B0DB|nr:histidine kinase dimerization/phospho-acceptor domain-containing protein [Pannonibacter phragmitetus]